MARISGKLTGKSLGWDRASVETAIKKVPGNGRVFIGRIAGTVTGLHDTFDEEKGEVQTGLKGEFRGISSLNEFVPVMDGDKPKRDDKDEIVMSDTGKPIVVTAGRCYLPSGLQDMLETAYKNAAFRKEIKDGKEVTVEDKSASITFTVDLYAKPENNKAGYTYDGDTVLEAAANDPLDTLLASAAAVKPLPGRSASAAIEDKSVDQEKTAEPETEKTTGKK